MSEDRRLHLFNDYVDSSFVELLRRQSPHLLPGVGTGPEVVEATHGTTVLALRYRDGVIMAGDRQATAGYQVASRRIEKIFKADDLSGVGIAGAAGPAMEMVELFQLQLRRPYLQALTRILQQQPERIGVGVTGVLAGASLSGKVLAEECLDVWCDRGHDRPPDRKFSPALAISLNSSAVLSRYQYVALMLTWPR